MPDTTTDPPKTPLRPVDVAARLGVSTETLRQWRAAGIGPPFHTLPSGRVRYDADQLTAGSSAEATLAGLRRWLEQQITEADGRRDAAEPGDQPGFHFWRGQAAALRDVQDRLTARGAPGHDQPEEGR